MKTVNQGRARSPYFTIMQPIPGQGIRINDPLLCINPNTNQETTGVVIDFWTFKWDEAPRGLILLAYGVDPIQLRKALSIKEPAFSESEVRMLLVRETI